MNGPPSETLAAVLAGPERDAAALVSPEDDVALTLGQLAEATDRLSGRLSALGVERGGRVALSLPNGPEIVVALLALARIGAAAAPSTRPTRPASSVSTWRTFAHDSYFSRVGAPRRT